MWPHGGATRFVFREAALLVLHARPTRARAVPARRAHGDARYPCPLTRIPAPHRGTTGRTPSAMRMPASHSSPASKDNPSPIDTVAEGTVPAEPWGISGGQGPPHRQPCDVGSPTR